MATPPKEIFKDRRVIAGLAVVGVAALAGTAFVLLGGGGGDDGSGGGGEDVAAAPPPVAVPGAPAGAAPGNPGAPGAPGVPAGGPPPGAGRQASAGPRPTASPTPPPTSFDRVPVLLGGTGTGGTTPGAPPAPAPAPGGAATGGAKPKPIVQGRIASNFRTDPFISRFIFAPEAPPAYSLAVPLRLARPYVPPVPKPADNLPPEIALGPLPPVQRRVAGVLYNGSVSAILESGQPGPSSQVDIIQPGSVIASGIAGVPSLTVQTITPTEVILRAPDGRTTRVPISGVPGGLQGVGGGVPGGGGPGGPPPGFGGPGGPPPGFGGPGRGGRGGFGGGAGGDR